MNKLIAFTMLAAMTLSAVLPRQLILIPNGDITLGAEFPGAKGKSEVSREKPITAKLDFDLTKGNYVGFVQRCTLPEGTTTFSFHACPSIPNTRLFIRTMDSKRRQHMRRIPPFSSPGQWKEFSVDLTKFEASWGPGDASIHWPITEVVIGIEVDKKLAIGTLELRDFTVTTTASKETMPSFTLQVTPQRFGALFYPDETPSISYTIIANELNSKPTLDIIHTVKNWKGDILFKEKIKTVPDKSVDFSMTAEKLRNQFGAFQLEIDAVNSSDPTDKTSFSTWFGRMISANPKPCPWVGTGLHSGHGWGYGDLRFIDILSAAGIGIVREEFGWRSIEQEKGKYVVSQNVINFVNRLYERGIRLNHICDYNNPIYENPLDSDAFARWTAFMAEFFKDKIYTYEIWNEPANFFFQKQYGGQRWGDAPWLIKFVELTRKANDAVRSVLPDANIAVCAEDVWPTLRQMVEKGIADEKNIISFHPYCHGQPRPEREMFFNDNGKAMREVCQKHGGAHQFIITESGWTTYSGDMQYLAIAGGYPRSSYVHQAQYVIRMLLSSKANGILYACQYDFRNDGPNRGYTEHNFGLVHEDFSPKPSLTAIAAMTRLLEDAQYIDDLSNHPETSRLYHFKDKNGQDVVAAYVIEGEQAVSLPVADNVKIIDLQGNPVPTTSRGGMLDVTLTETPIYIYGLDCQKLAKRIRLAVDFDASIVIGGTRPMSFKSNGSVVLDTPTTLKFRLDVQNLTGERILNAAPMAVFEPSPAGFKRVIPVTKKISLGMNTLYQQICEIQLDPEEWRPLMNQTIKMTVTCNANGCTDSATAFFTILPPITLNCSTIVMHDGKPAIPVAVQNNLPDRMVYPTFDAVSKDIELLPNQQAEISINSQKIVWLYLKSMPKSDKAVISLTPKDMKLPTETKTFTLRSAIIPQTPQRIPFAAEPIYIPLPDKKPKPINPNDLSANAFLSKSDKGLVITVDVNDDKFFQPFSNLGDVWQGDSVQLSIAPLDGQKSVSLMLALLARKPTVLVETRLNPDSKAEDFPLSIIGSTNGDGPLQYTVTIPWEALPGIKGNCRISLLVNDNDGNGRKGWIEFHSGIGSFKDTSLFGTYSF
ncbi:MAG: hypothetical protein K6G44_15430 [Lentisphaeria bacterium]|nr:hypothetical protein [Lentisphaeria bacterium]